MKRCKTAKFIGLFVYFFFYLINSEFAIGENQTKYILSNLENALNDRDLKTINNYFEKAEGLKITNQFTNLIEDFPNSIWQITYKDSIKKDNDFFEVNLIGTKILDGKELILESNFDYYFAISNGKIKNGQIKNLLTIIRNDDEFIDFEINIPDTVLSGSNYHLDIIINTPLGDQIYAGALAPHQQNSIIEQNIFLEPLLAGGMFKVTRAPNKAGIQIWSGIIAHPKGLVTFTKTVEIVDKF